MIKRGIAALVFSGCVAAAQTGTIDFDREIHPILAAKCHSCHSQEKRSGGLSLGTLRDTLDGGRSGAAVRPGKSRGSLLISRIDGSTNPRMPLGSEALSAPEVALIAKWIDEGARATPRSGAARAKWEAPLELKKPRIPGVVWEGWEQPVDRFVAAYLAKRGVAKPALVSDAQYARRVSLDLNGLLPSGEMPREQRVAKLLESPQYAEHWISFWNDLLRNDEGVNYYSETASRKSISQWLFNALDANLPYDRMVSALLNPVTINDPEGFLIGVNWRGAVNASQTPYMQAAQNTAQVFLGINLKCNSCHDSFISKWKLKDAYALAAYFSLEPKLQLFRCDSPQDQYTEAGFLYPALSHKPASSALADRRAAAAATFLDPRNGRLARTMVNRIWERLLGRGLVELPDEMDGEPWNPELLDYLAADFAENNYDLKRLIATIAMSNAYQMPSVARKERAAGEYVFRGPEIRRMTAEQFADAVGMLTGDWHPYRPAPTSDARYGREWRVKASNLTRALGRPIRDQVYSGRETDATTLQALELVNGEALTHWLQRGAKRMLGQLPPAPVAVFDKTYVVRNGPQKFDVDVAGAKKLWLVVSDTGSYSPEKVEAVWRGTPLDTLKPLSGNGLREAEGPGVHVKTPSVVVFDIAGKGITRLSGEVALENKEITSEINPQVRFFVFTEEPNMEQLTPVTPGNPVKDAPVVRSSAEVVERVFRFALGRSPSTAERSIAMEAVGAGGKPTADGVADLLWAVLMKPEFQLIY